MPAAKQRSKCLSGIYMPSPVLHTGQFRTTSFSPHGEIALWYEDRILHYDAMGPFNTELVDALALAQKEFLQHINPQGPWGSIAVFKNSAIMGPDTLARYEGMMSAPKPPGKTPVATAFVMGPDVDGHRLMRPLFERIYRHIGRPFIAVETLDEGRRWVLAQIESARQDKTDEPTNS